MVQNDPKAIRKENYPVENKIGKFASWFIRGGGEMFAKSFVWGIIVAQKKEKAAPRPPAHVPLSFQFPSCM